jgi:hypothetical protein
MVQPAHLTLSQKRPQTQQEFTAHPRILSKMDMNTVQHDPIRDFVKVMPQNIMYDRRVVRGNTFAALVIPVSKLLKLLTPLICRHAK